MKKLNTSSLKITTYLKIDIVTSVVLIKKSITHTYQLIPCWHSKIIRAIHKQRCFHVENNGICNEG